MEVIDDRGPGLERLPLLRVRVQRTILEECWRPSFARALVPRYTALKRDLEAYLNYYNYERAHTGRRNLGRTPAELVYGARKMRPR